MPRSKLGSLRPREGGSWTSQIRNPNTGRFETTTWPATLTKTEVNKRHHAWCLGILDRTQATSRDPLADYLARWLELIEPTVSPASHITYRRAVDRITAIAGSRKLKDVDPQLVDHILTELRARYAHSTVGNTKAVLVTALDRAVHWGLLPRNPAKVVKVGRRPTNRAPGRDPKVPTRDEFDRIVAAEPSPMWATFWTVLFGTGCRPGEILAARWGDLDLTAGVFDVTRTVTKDAANRQVVGTATKNRKDRRVTFDAATGAALKAWRQELAGRNLMLVGPDQNVWPSPKLPGEPLQAVTVFYAWKAACTRAGVPGPPNGRTLHGVRHLHASTLMAAGVHPQAVADRLGHSIQQTMSTYGIHMPPDGQRVEAALNTTRRATAPT